MNAFELLEARRRHEPAWLTVRVGDDHRDSAARYFISGPREVPRLLDRVLELIGAPPEPV